MIIESLTLKGYIIAQHRSIEMATVVRIATLLTVFSSQEIILPL
jgi:hypothetical protein